MAVTATEITDDNRYSMEQAIHYWHVDGLDFATKGRAAVLDALSAPGIPIKNAPHPFIPNLSARPPELVTIHSPTRATVSCEYTENDILDEDGIGGDTTDGDDSRTTVRMGSVLELQTTSRDVNGDPIFIPYSFDHDKDDGGYTIYNDDGTVAQTKVGETNVLRPRLSMIISRDEPQLPAFEFDKHMATINRSRWLNPFGRDFRAVDEPHCWLLASITTSDATRQQRSRWGPCRVTYEFIFNHESWNPVVVLTNPDTGQPFDNTQSVPIRKVGNLRLPAKPGTYNPDGKGKDMANGMRVVQVQGESEFNDLRLGGSNGRAFR